MKDILRKNAVKITLFSISLIVIQILAQLTSVSLITNIFSISYDELRKVIFEAAYVHFMFIFIFISTIFYVILSFLFRKFIDQNTFISLGVSTKGRAKDFLVGCAIGIMLIAIIFTLLLVTGQTTVSASTPDIKLLAYFVAICLMIAFYEELVVRGYILNNLLNGTKPWVAVMISSIVFLALHLVNPGLNPVALINLLIGGIFFGVAYLATRNLWFPIGIHFGWNFAQGPLFGFKVSGHQMEGILHQKNTLEASTLLTGGDFGLEGSLLTTMLITLITLFIGMYGNKKGNL